MAIFIDGAPHGIGLIDGVPIAEVKLNGQVLWQSLAKGFVQDAPMVLADWNDWSLVDTTANDIYQDHMRFQGDSPSYYITRAVTVTPGREYTFNITGAAGSGFLNRDLKVGTAPNDSSIAFLDITSGDWIGGNHEVLFTPAVGTVYVTLTCPASAPAYSVFSYVECVPV